MKYLFIIVALAWTGIFIYMGNLADAEETKAFEYYCAMVQDGAWPDFKNSLGNCNEK